MPYIKPEDRKKFEEVIKELMRLISEEKEEDQDGCINYCFTRILDGIYPLRYRHVNRAVGVIECIKQEYYRRIAGPYEDEKIKENGDAYPNLTKKGKKNKY